LAYQGGAAQNAVKPKTEVPQLQDGVAAMLKWHCEDMDHEADQICGLLWSHRHLRQTHDPTQVSGLSKQMLNLTPTSPAAFELAFGDINRNYCARGNAGASWGLCPPSALTPAKLFRVRPSTPVEVESISRNAPAAVVQAAFRKLVQDQARCQNAQCRGELKQRFQALERVRAGGRGARGRGRGRGGGQRPGQRRLGAGGRKGRRRGPRSEL